MPTRMPRNSSGISATVTGFWKLSANPVTSAYSGRGTYGQSCSDGVPVHCDLEALNADHLVVVNRVKLHSRFHNDVQSGLLKMMAMGLGKLNGSQLYYQAVEDYRFEELTHGVHTVMLEKANILAGLMVLENSREQTARVLAALP